MTTYIQLLNKIEAFCDAHYQIQRYGGEFREQMPNLSTESEKYPIVFVTPTNGVPMYDTNQISLDIYCVDIIQKGRENLNTILSDCHLILTDLYGYFSQGSDLSVDVIGQPSQEPLNNLDLDYVAGWKMTIVFEVDGYCVEAIPMGTIPSGGGECADATYIVEYADGTPIESGTIASGTTKTVIVPDCPTCDVASWTLKDTLGNVLDSGTIPSGGSSDITAPSSIYTIKDDSGNTLYSGAITSGGSLTQEIADSTAVLKDTAGTTLSTTSINAEGSSDITAPDGTVTITDDSANVLHTVNVRSNGSASQVISDSTVTITDDSANTLYTLSVNAEGSASQVITDSTVTIKDDSNNTLHTVSVNAQGAAEQIISDSTVTITDDSANTLYTLSVNAEGSASQIITDSTVTIKDDSNNTLHTVSVNAQGSAEQIISDSTVQNSDASYSVGVNAEGSLTVPNSQINVNGVDEGDVVSVKTIDVNITDGVDPVTPDSVSLVGNTLTVTVPSGGVTPVGAMPLKTNQTTSYATGDDGDLESGRATDFFTLASNNPFGNTSRFTAIDGTQTYTVRIVIDWSTFDGTNVLGYGQNNNINVNWSDALTGAAAHSVGVYTSGWRLPNNNEVYHLFNLEEIYQFNYAPLQSSLGLGGTSNRNYWLSNTWKLNTGSAYKIDTIYGIQTNNKGNVNCKYFPVRTFTVNGTTLT